MVFCIVQDILRWKTFLSSCSNIRGKNNLAVHCGTVPLVQIYADTHKVITQWEKGGKFTLTLNSGLDVSCREHILRRLEAGTGGLVGQGVEARRISTTISRITNAVCIDMCHSCTAAK